MKDASPLLILRIVMLFFSILLEDWFYISIHDCFMACGIHNHIYKQWVLDLWILLGWRLRDKVDFLGVLSFLAY